jgi:hypothetical protein
MPPPKITMRSSDALLALILRVRSARLLQCTLCVRCALRPNEFTVLSAKQSVKGTNVFMNTKKKTGSVQILCCCGVCSQVGCSMQLRAIAWLAALVKLPLMLAFVARSSSNCLVQHTPAIRAAAAPVLVSRLGVELPSLTHRDLPEETLWVLDGTSMLFRAHFGKGSDRLAVSLQLHFSQRCSVLKLSYAWHCCCMQLPGSRWSD